MFRFENEIYLNLLYFIPFFILLFIINIILEKRKLVRLGQSEFISKLMSDKSNFKKYFKFLIYLISFSSLVIAIANPQMGTKLEKVKREGIEIIIALDISQSMLSEDVKPSRLERARQSIYNLIDKLVNDKLGLICFAGNSYLHLPLTTDYSAAKLITSTVSTDLIQSQGTAIGSAIELAEKSFSEQDKISKALVIITDGENHEDDAISAAKNIAEKGIKVHCIGMGSLKGGPIPLYRNGNLTGFLKDESGNTVITKLDATALQQIASVGGGNFIRINNETDIMDIIKNLSGMEKTEFETKIYKEYESFFQYFLALALILILLENIISNRKSLFFEKIGLSSIQNKLTKNNITKGNLPIIILVFLLQCYSTLAADNTIYDGNKAYKEKKYKDAEKKYREGIKNIENQKEIDQKLNHNKLIAKYNLANSLYKQDSSQNSLDYYNDVINSKTNDSLKFKSYHNLGNSYLKNKKYKESIDAYISALKINDNDKDTKYNLEYARKMLESQQNQQQNGNGNQNQDNKNQNKDNQNKDGENKNDKNSDKNKEDDKNKNGDKQDQNKYGKQDKDQNKEQNKDKNGQQGEQNQEQNNKEQNGKSQPRKAQISKDDAERILQAIQNNERKLLKEKLRENTKSKTGKKW